MKSQTHQATLSKFDQRMNYWRVPKFLGRSTWGSNYVQMRKELELGVAPDFQH
jgi:hypothetical protein